MPAGACTVMMVGILKFLTNQLSFLQAIKVVFLRIGIRKSFFRTNPDSHQSHQTQIYSTLIKLAGKKIICNAEEGVNEDAHIFCCRLMLVHNAPSFSAITVRVAFYLVLLLFCPSVSLVEFAFLADRRDGPRAQIRRQ